ncbi:hypothetical protein EEc2_0030 [Escherichia phage EEc2]|uniref:HNH nuclease domain-containing protein n=1 Tax=Escherichia phage EEc2 TaxID=2950297 RepID=A0A9E7LPF9_9CAUD|nr:hypothetical protein EEc2_0030 [Escherichia phage EEc2]
MSSNPNYRKPPRTPPRPLAYCPFTGKLFRKFKDGWRETGLSRKSDGYLQCKVDGKTVSVHVLAMNMMGYDTTGFTVDHINHIRWDNRFINLRLLSHKDNCLNREAIHISKLPSGNYRARCGNVHLGVFEDKLLARGAILWYRHRRFNNVKFNEGNACRRSSRSYI